jgi:DNA repair protein RecN (Recombination protein N)
MQELSRSVADAASRTDMGDESLEELDRRLTAVNRLKRKYGADIAGILELAETKRRRIDELEHRAERIAELEKELAAALPAVEAAGKALRSARTRAGEALAAAVTSELRDLGFLKAGFSVAVEPAPASADGCDSVSFMFAPNPGEAARPLADIASSGETARVMLSLKGVLAAADPVDVLVFDEIDANIGGETGRAVGEKMRRAAAHHQVIAITHLPQSAVYGDRHLVVGKSVEGGRTKVWISRAEGEIRISEIARMLGGEELTSVVRKHAEELLQLSR